MNSVESKAKRVCSLLTYDDSVDVLERATEMVEGESWCVGCDAAKPEPKARISTRAIAWAALFVGLFLPPLVPLDEIIGTASAWRGPAVGFHEASLVTTVVRMGEPLILKTKSQYLKTCAWHWTLEWRRAEDNRPIALESHFGTAHVIGALAEHQMAFALPLGIKPGNYIFHDSAQGECGHGDIAQIIDPDMPFTVTN